MSMLYDTYGKEYGDFITDLNYILFENDITALKIV